MQEFLEIFCKAFQLKYKRLTDEERTTLKLSLIHIYLLCDLHKSLRNFFGSVAGIRCRGFTLPAFLPAVCLLYTSRCV